MQPLSDLKILDFTTLLPGPFATMYLADWGAEVLRIEAPDRDDLSRSMPPFVEGVSTTHALLNRSKQSLVVDLKDPSARDRIYDLIKSYDIVIEQFRPGVMARLGLDYATLRAINPRLIYCSLTGYGQDGPYKNRAGHDINYAALSGLAAMTGTTADGPALHGNPVCDLSGSMHALFAIMMAVYHRQKTSEGQSIDISITDCNLLSSGLWLQMLGAGRERPTWQSTVLNGSSYYGYYRTKDDRYLSVGSLEAKFYKGFLEAIDSLDLLGIDAQRNGHVLKAAIQNRIERKDLSAWMAIFSTLDLCVEPVLNLDQIADHPQFKARNVFAYVKAPSGQSIKQLASPLRFSAFRPIYRHIGLQKGRRSLIDSQEASQ